MTEHIFITGATGFIAGALIERLLARSGPQRLVFLVRSDSPSEGLSRLRHSLSRFRVTQAQLAHLSSDDIVCGDLLEPRSWLTDVRVTQASRIVNCGASTAFGQDRLAWAVNHEGTLEFARAAHQFGTLERFLHVGTAMCCGPDRDKLVEESLASAAAEDHYVAYTASKALFEQQVRSELPDLPLVIARPSIVLGHTALGCAPSTSIYWILRMAREIGGFSCLPSDTIDIVPVDWVADALERLLFAGTLKNDLYHLSAGISGRMRFSELDLAFARASGTPPLGENYRHLNDSELQRAVQDLPNQLNRAERRLAGMALTLYGAFAQLSYTFCNQRILDEGMPQPARLTDYLNVCVDTARNIPLGDQIRYDVKLPRPQSPRVAAPQDAREGAHATLLTA